MLFVHCKSSPIFWKYSCKTLWLSFIFHISVENQVGSFFKETNWLLVARKALHWNAFLAILLITFFCRCVMVLFLQMNNFYNPDNKALVFWGLIFKVRLEYKIIEDYLFVLFARIGKSSVTYRYHQFSILTVSILEQLPFYLQIRIYSRTSLRWTSFGTSKSVRLIEMSVL